MTGAPRDTTITRSPSWRAPGGGGDGAIFVVLHADEPAAGARVHLRDTRQATLGRSDARRVHRAADGTLRIDLPDDHVSVDHARLERGPDGWTVEDLDSKNGLYVNGQRIERCLLEDGAWIEVGHTFLRYREPIAAGDAVDEARTLLPEVQAEIDKVGQVAETAVPVLFLGETGSGKEVLARRLHELSHRAGPFVVLNCGAIPATLVEATLFGHRRGAFSGAIEERPGIVSSADGGTLLLDEIGDLPAAQQAALLRAVQEKEIVPIGETRPRKVDVRFAAATHRDLDALVAEERFRADLLARLSGVRVVVPPLRQRIEDLGILVANILAGAGAARCTLARDAAWALCRYRWPLNVRELEQALTAAVALSGGREILVSHLPDRVRAPSAGAIDRDRARREELVARVQKYRGNLAAVARSLKTSRMQVHRLLERYGIDPRAYR